ncbi:RNA polymerase sigma factor [Paenibacillus sp. R14(2021)]|uniref:RNA polymerase sigma factor n=1 Tax=Paenibacillus sp. R14(2021) TaxID=2859228 RepID=UPI001C615C8A|nr:RNA polymerase sigma factor [Paenibacillus sp. R14(2021)]
MTTELKVEEMRFVLYKYCLSLTRSSWDADDLVQETCLRALPVMNGTLEHPNPTAYLLRIAKNIAVDQARRKQRAGQALQRMEAVLNQLYGDSHEMEYALKLLIQHLSPLQQTVFLLKELFGFKSAEIAAKLTTSEGAVKAALHRAKSAIAKLKQQHGFLLEEASLVEPQVDHGLLFAYANAIRQGDAQALVVLANVQDRIMDPVQAVGQLHQLQASQGIGSSVSMLYAA